MVDLALFSDWTRCSFCGLPSGQKPTPGDPTCPRAVPQKKLFACSDCGCVAYHDSECQRSHWKAGHRRDCKELSRAVLPLKELIRWQKLNKKVKKRDGDDDPTGDKRVWCWWEPDNENGITENTLDASNEVCGSNPCGSYAEHI